MLTGASFENFAKELSRLVETFGKNLTAYKSAAYDEASLRQEFLNPFFRALGWDIENRAGLIPQHREVETESRTRIGGRQRQTEELHSGFTFQAKRHAWNKDIQLAFLNCQFFLSSLRNPAYFERHAG